MKVQPEVGVHKMTGWSIFGPNSAAPGSLPIHDQNCEDFPKFDIMSEFHTIEIKFRSIEQTVKIFSCCRHLA